MYGRKYRVVGSYNDGFNCILAFPGDRPDTLSSARERIRWQRHPGSTTSWHICEPDPDARGVMIEKNTGRRFTVSPGPLTERACKELWDEIWG